MKPWMLALVLAVIAIAPLGLLAYYYTRVSRDTAADQSIVQFETQRPPQKMEVGAEFPVRACKVLDGFRFEMFLEGGKSIEAHLTAAAKEEAAPVVVDMLNKAEQPPPVITLRRQVGNYWIVDFSLTVEGKRCNMVDLLRAKGLLL